MRHWMPFIERWNDEYGGKTFWNDSDVVIQIWNVTDIDQVTFMHEAIT